MADGSTKEPAMRRPRALHPWSRAVFVAWAGLALASCSSSGDRGDECDPAVTRANLPCDDADVLAAVRLLRAMSLEEKVEQMSGPAYNPNNMFDQQSNARLGIPGFRYMDGPRGVRWYNSDYGTTVYPVAAARASTWNLELERRIAKAMAKEMRYLGRHVLLAPTINQVTHPRWGRAQETYGEDAFLLGEMGASFIRGAEHDPRVADPGDPDHVVQDTYRIQACAKHFAANNIEDTRIYVNAVMDERTLREVYLPHFKRASDEGVSCFMTAYNRVNGSYAGYSKDLVRDLLKGEWGYQGYVISDWFAKGLTVPSALAGLDVEMPFSSGPFPSMFDSAYYYGNLLTTAVRNGQVSESVVDEAVLRILYRKVSYGLMSHAIPWTPWLTKSDATQELAHQAAREGIVLLKNGPTAALDDDALPLARSGVNKIAVVGKFANSENMGDKGSSDAKVVDGALVFTPYEGLKEALGATHASTTACPATGKCVVTYETVAGNEAQVGSADVVVVVGAYFYADLARSSAGEEGEWKDRVSMNLPARDLANIANAVALKSASPDLKVVVVLKSGGAVLVDDWIGGVDAALMAWFAGMREGTALAEILFGDVNPSGKLVQSFPKREIDLPPFDNTTTGNVNYDYYHGYRWLDRQGVAPRYHFGYGLSYTTFSYSNLVVASSTVGADGTLTVTVDVTNTGPVTGSEVVQLYVGYDGTAVTSGWGRPVKELKAFARAADIAPGATRTVALSVKAGDLRYWDTGSRTWKVERMAHQLYVGPSADAADPNMLTGTFIIE
jgi:beta-glucosidase